MINAHEIWNARILKKQHIGTWDIRLFEKLLTINEINHSNTIDIMDQMPHQTIINYTNSKDIIFNNTNKDILFHVINHSTYHRAQIASDLKLHNIAPINTDYIIYKRR